jgi:hypothetical protein
MLRRLAALDLLRPIHAALPSRRSTLQRLERQVKPRADTAALAARRDLRWLLWLIGLSAAQIRSINRRLHFRRELLEAMLAAAALNRQAASFVRWKPSRLTAYLDKSPLLAVQGACESAINARVKEVLQEYLTRWRELKPVTTGKDLKPVACRPVQRIIILRTAYYLVGWVHHSRRGEKELEITRTDPWGAEPSGARHSARFTLAKRTTESPHPQGYSNGCQYP